jgi:glycosyltransferase involved in cell wall biosynthesis
VTAPGSLTFLVPGELRTRTGGYGYARRILAGLRGLGWEVQVRSLDPRFPHPSAAALESADALLSGIAAGALVVIDGLALGAMPEVAERHGPRLRVIALVHHPLALETGLDQATAERLRWSERRALAAVQGVITTSPSTAAALDDFGVARDRVRVVTPGTDPAPLAEGSGSETLSLLCVATLTPRKGHALLFESLAALRDLPWRLTCAGSAERDPECALALAQQIRALGLGYRIQLVGELSDEALAALYQRADAFVLASHHEGYGMVLAEALAHGLPIVATGAGAIPDTVPADAGLLTPPGDPAALTTALRRLLEDSELRARLKAGARGVRARLVSWDSAATAFAAALVELGSGKPAAPPAV